MIKKTKVYVIRATEEEYTAWKEAADYCNTALPKWCRRALGDSAEYDLSKKWEEENVPGGEKHQS